MQTSAREIFSSKNSTVAYSGIGFFAADPARAEAKP